MQLSMTQVEQQQEERTEESVFYEFVGDGARVDEDFIESHLVV